MVKKLVLIFAALIAFCFAEDESYKDKVVVIEVGESALVNKKSFTFWQRTLERVNNEGAKAVIFTLDTPGGLAFDTRDLMVQELRDLKVPSYAFVDDDAISAGALISIACDHIWMAPGSRIGAAAIVNGSGQPIEETMREKLESVFAASIRSVTKDKGHPTPIVEMMMFRENKARKYGPITVKKNELLTLTAEEAVQKHKGKPVLADGLANSLEDLIEKLGYDRAGVVIAEKKGFEVLAYHISAWSWLLILIGIGGIYFEAKTPGLGIGAIVALSAFGIFFFGNFVAGKLVGYEVISIFIIGLVLVIIELTLFPTGVLGLIGAVMMIGSLLFAMVDKIDWKRIGESDVISGEEFSLLDALYWPMISISAGLIGGIILILIMMKYLPHVPIPGFMLERVIGAGGSVQVNGGEEYTDSLVHELVGKQGVAIMDLRPAGKIEVGDRKLDVITNGEFIEKGAKVRIIAKEQMRTVVEEIIESEN